MNTTTAYRILFLTDNTPLTAAMEEYLAGGAFAITVMPGGRKLVRSMTDLMKKERFDIVLVDMVSLIYGGSDLVRRIKTADDRAGIVLLASHGSGTLAVEHMKDGADDFVPRPIKREHLLMVLNRVIDKKKRMNADRDPYRHTPMVDDLTGLYNRSYFQERAIQEINASRRSKGGFSIILMEIGGLKEINSSYGRLAGDRVLKNVSALVQKQCRGCDTVARWGGDEFSIILRDASSEEARRVANRIMASVQAGEYDGIEDRSIQTSIGISSYPGHAEDMKDLLGKADLALTRSRSFGGGSSLYGNGECSNGAAL
jgi:diguanylate cyclase (GGDEF)-like protein